MTSFSELGIKPKTTGFKGDSIHIWELFDKEIKIIRYNIEPSKFTDKGCGKRLSIQITVNGVERLLWTGSEILMDQIERAPKENFPLTTKIIRNGKRFEFL